MKRYVTFDTECYHNLWCCNFLDVLTKNEKSLALHSESPLDVTLLESSLRKCTLISFNGMKYDIPMISYALTGATNEQLKAANDYYFGYKKWHGKDLMPWEFASKFGFDLLEDLDHIDLIEVAPGVMDSLKIYGGRMHTEMMQDLPFKPDTILTLDQIKLVIKYCFHDCKVTLQLYESLKEPLELRFKMTAQYGIDLRSKSDAQIAEAVICSEVQKCMDGPIKRHNIKVGYEFTYSVPDFISFNTPYMNAVLNRFSSSKFVVNAKHKVESVYAHLDEPISIHGTEYQFGMGGLHSKETNFSCRSDVDTQLFDIDATSFYPSVIIVCGLFPPQLTDAFLTVFKKIVDTRIAAKKSGDTATAQSMKIMINGTFGKLGSWYSKMFSPELMIQTTLTGQLVALMLIERLELAGIHIASANTDGITVMCPRNMIDIKNEIVRQWEKDTDFQLEESKYIAVYSQSVNSYIAVKPGDKFKRKGEFCETDLQHNPNNQIIGDAICEYISNGTAVEESIRACTDIRQFIEVRRVNDGALYGASVDTVYEKKKVISKTISGGCLIGKAIRWYHSTSPVESIRASESGNKVADTEGAMPCMMLPDEFPNDVDYEWYIRRAYDLMYTPGYRNVGGDASGIGICPQKLYAGLYLDFTEDLMELQ